VVNWRRAEELLAETAREVGVLMAVFTPLEAAFSDKTTSVGFVVILFFVGVGLVAGIIIGARR
jgi:phosphate/sulfate permease